jgi:hypothetical protein
VCLLELLGRLEPEGGMEALVVVPMHPLEQDLDDVRFVCLEASGKPLRRNQTVIFRRP